jgi:hypothetical protein
MFVNIKMVINILMNDFYYRLNILENPVKDRDAVINMYKSAKGSYSVESASILKDEVIDLFSDIGLTVDHIIIFTLFNEYDKLDDKRLIHSDLTWDEELSKWRKTVCTVNWELTPICGDFKWFDMNGAKEVWPSNDTADKLPLRKLAGLHYGSFRHIGLPDGARVIHDVSTNYPLLLNTDIPHCVSFTDKGRMPLSVRFTTKWKSWEEVIPVFRKYLFL